MVKSNRKAVCFIAFLSFFFLFSLPDLHSKDFYLDPVNGKIDGDGSIVNPLPSLQEVIEKKLISGYQCETLPYKPDCNKVLKNPDAPIKGGDRLLLMNGYHGSITIQDLYQNDPVIVEAAPGHKPRIKNIRCLGASKWVLRGLYISPSFAEPYEKVSTLVVFENHNFRGPCTDSVIEGSEIFSVKDTSQWTQDDWNNLSCSGISVQADNCEVKNNYLKNVNFGISVSGKNAKVIGNTVENFAGDGLRGLGDYGLFEDNLVMNCYAVNQNHDDGFQSWSVGTDGQVGTGEVKGVILRGNMIINYTDPNQPFRGTLQGIGCFDGFYTDWVVENNVIITDHWHGISFYGAKNVRIINNTVVDINTESPGPPWIRINPHKDGRPSEGCIVRNNITTSLQVGSETISDHNLKIDSVWAEKYFVNYAGFDLHLTPDSPAIDSGESEFAPLYDKDKVKRPQGNAVDLGAYEYVPPQPDAGSGDATNEDILLSDDGPKTDDAIVVTDDGGSNIPDAGDDVADYYSGDDTALTDNGNISDISVPDTGKRPDGITLNEDVSTDNPEESSGCACSLVY